MTRVLRVLCLLLAGGGVAAAQEAPAAEATIDKAAHALMQDTLLQAERWLLEMFVQPGKDVPAVVLQELESLDAAVQGGYFRDLAQRSGMLVFLTREEVRLVQERRQAAETAQSLLRQSRVERRQERKRRATVTFFWGYLGTALAAFAGSYGCWYAAEHLDRRHLEAGSPRKAALYKTWSDVFEVVSYAGAGIGVVGVSLSLPALSRMRPR